MKHRILMMVLAIGTGLGMTGCNSLRDYIDEVQFSRITSRQAHRAWKVSRPEYMNLQHDLRDFGSGFVAGYIAVAGGGNGCPPSIPPREYWSAKYSTPLGKKRIVAWFDGYGHGAAAAFADGAQERGRLLTAGEIYGRCRQYVEYAPPIGEPLPVGAEPTGPGLELPVPEVTPVPGRIDIPDVPPGRTYVPGVGGDASQDKP